MLLNSARELIDQLERLIKKSTDNRKRSNILTQLQNIDSTFKMGRVSPDYVSGRPSIIFEGEVQPSLKQYPYLESYQPKANDVVILARISGTYVILGRRI